MTDKPKHTPGPWTVRDDKAAWAIIGSEPSWVTEVNKNRHNADANAALIASAPDLLAALEGSRQYVIAWRYEYASKPQDEHNNSQRDLIDASIRKIEAAIAKARGQ